VYIVILFGRCGTGIILVFFLAPPLLQNSKGTPQLGR